MSRDITLRTEGLSKRWGAFVANSDVSLTFEPGARHALIGPNGAGKTTFINLLTGAFSPSSGKVYLGGEDITHLPQHARVHCGMTRTFQLNTLFAGMTVLESVALAISERRGLQNVWWKTVANHPEVISEAMELLAALKLSDQANSITRSMAYGKQRLVEIALALATKPRILLLDEPMEGLAPIIVQELVRVIRKLVQEEGMSVIVVEQHARLALSLTQRAIVLDRGRIVHDSDSASLLADGDKLDKLVAVA